MYFTFHWTDKVAGRFRKQQASIEAPNLRAAQIRFLKEVGRELYTVE